jgi:hypothetical protein
MTDTNSAPDPTGFQREFDEKQRAYKLLSEAIHTANKEALFEPLAAAGIISVLVRFDGCGDSGQIEAIEVVSGEKPATLPAGTVQIQSVHWGACEAETRESSIGDAIETVVYDLLEETHSGWENNEGAYGEFTFDVSGRTITLDYNERYETSNYTQHNF